MKRFILSLSVLLLFIIVIVSITGVSIKESERTTGTLTLSVSDSSTLTGDIYVFMYNRSGGLSSICLSAENGYKDTRDLHFDEYWINEVSNSNYEVEGYSVKDAYFELTSDNPDAFVVIDVEYSIPMVDKVIGEIEENIFEPSDSSDSIEEVEFSEVSNQVVEEEIEEEIEDLVEVESSVENEEKIEEKVEETVEVDENKPIEQPEEPKETEKIEEVKELSYPITYSDSTATITIYKEWYAKAWCYIAHLEFTDYSRFGTYCANGKYNNGYQKTSNAAKKIGAIFCVNGCYSAPYLEYGVIRSGVVCNDKKYGYVAGYSNVSGLFGELVKDKYNGPSLTELAETGVVTDTFCFGPAILVDGIVLENKDTSRAQRTFIGSNGNAGDIWIIVSDGRLNDGESYGLTYMECAQLLLDKGCTYGIPLDGGGSSTMYFQGEVLNANGKKERAVVDFVYFK